MSDKLIEELLKTASDKEASIEKIQRYSNLTNLSFPWDESSSKATNLNVIKDIREFVKILAFLKTQKENFIEAAKELGVKFNFQWGGFSYEDWRSDIKNKVDTINLKKQREELKEIKDQLNELMSPEMQRELKIKKLAEKLGGA